MKLLVLATMVVFLILILSGCESRRGPLTAGNIIQGWPSKVRSVDANLEASLIQVRFQPYDAQRVEIEGWFFTPDDPNSTDRRQIRFNENVISGVDTTDGTALFVVASFDFPSNFHGNAMTPGIKYFFMITVEDNSDHRKVEVWEVRDGVASPVSRES